MIGFLGSDAEQRTTKNGASYTVLSLATKRSWKNDQGNYESRSYWHRAVAWNKLAAFAATLKKGAHLQLVGEIRPASTKKSTARKQVVAQTCFVGLRLLPSEAGVLIGRQSRQAGSISSVTSDE